MPLLKESLMTVITVGILVSLNGCAPNQSITTSNTRPALAPLTQTDNRLPTNFKTQPDSDAENIIYQFYDALNKKQYRTAYNFLGSRLRVFDYNTQVKQWESISFSKVILLKDVTSKPDQLSWPTDKYFEVKVYYGILKQVTSNSKLQMALDQYDHRRFFVVKENKNGLWLLDAYQGYPAQEAESLWGK